MSILGKRQPKVNLSPPYGRGPDTVAADGKLLNREVEYLAKLTAGGIDLRAPRRVTFMFVYQTRGAAEAVVARFEGPKFSGMVVDPLRGGGGSGFTLNAPEFALDPGLVEWSKAFRDVETDDVSYMGWVADFPEVSGKASGTFLREF
jgi:hypothetical protein